MITHTDSAFSLSYPAQWDYKEGTGRYGIYNNFVGPKAASGYEPAVLVGRTVGADAQAFADGMTLFQTIHPDRKLQPAHPDAAEPSPRSASNSPTPQPATPAPTGPSPPASTASLTYKIQLTMSGVLESDPDGDAE